MGADVDAVVFFFGLGLTGSGSGSGSDSAVWRVSGSGNTAAALRRYEQRRKPRATRLQEVSRRNGKLYHLGTSLSRRWLYAPLAGVSRLAPGFFAGQLDWLYGEDVTRGD